MALFHYNVATEGIRAGHKILAVLGLSWLTIDIIVPPVVPTKPEQKGGGGSGARLDHTYVSDYYTIRVTIRINGKTVVKMYKTKFADVVAKIIIKLQENVTAPFSVFARYVSNEIITKLIKVSEYHVNEDIQQVNIDVKSKAPIITVRHKQ